ncbi:MAG: aminotransferase class IV [Myxococcota bacterium]|nr:aminotransferase class IV [Myxococcota bacterium]
MDSFSFRNGVPQLGHVHHGYAVFTTLRVAQGRALFWTLHRERLLQSSSYMKISLDMTRIEEDVAVAARRLRTGAIRVLVATEEWWLHAWKPNIDEAQPLTVCWLEWEPSSWLPAWVKHSNRAEWRMAKQQKGVDEILLYDRQKFVLEASRGNLFLARGDALYTPKANGRILDGVGRRSIIELAKDVGVPIYEVNLPPEEGSWWLVSALRNFQRLSVSPVAVPRSVEVLQRTFAERYL